MAVGTSPRRAPLAAHGRLRPKMRGAQDRGSMLDFETKFKMYRFLNLVWCFLKACSN